MAFRQQDSSLDGPNTPRPPQSGWQADAGSTSESSLPAGLQDHSGQGRGCSSAEYAMFLGGVSQLRMWLHVSTEMYYLECRQFRYSSGIRLAVVELVRLRLQDLRQTMLAPGSLLPYGQAMPSYPRLCICNTSNRQGRLRQQRL